MQAEENIIEKYLHFACSEINKIIPGSKKKHVKILNFIDLSEKFKGENSSVFVVNWIFLLLGIRRTPAAL